MLDALVVDLVQPPAIEAPCPLDHVSAVVGLDVDVAVDLSDDDLEALDVNALVADVL